MDVAEGEDPPDPNETRMVTSDGIISGETMVQDFIRPDVIQSNKTGVLVALPQEHGHTIYRRTSKLTALGFEPIMNMIELVEEQEALLERVAKNTPRRRKQTLSVTGVDFNYGYYSFGNDNFGVFDV